MHSIVSIGWQFLFNREIQYFSLSEKNNISLSDYNVIFLDIDWSKDKSTDDYIIRKSGIWKEEINAFLDRGGSIIVRLSNLSKHSSSMRDEYIYSCYDLILPDHIQFKLLNGNKIKARDPICIEFYEKYKSLISYKVILSNIKEKKPVFTDNASSHTVGLYSSSGKSNGSILYIPYIECKDPSIEAVLINDLLELNENLKLGKRTIKPEWLVEDLFKLSSAEKLKERIHYNNEKIEKLEEENHTLQLEAENIEGLQSLLYETGKPLEESVRKALKILGYQAEGYDNGKLELDQVLVSPEGIKFIGECEGRDDKPIALKKFRQLLDSLKNYMYSEDEIKEVYGILIGNPFRLTNPEKRGNEEFTPHCIDGARREKIGLLTTDSLFYVARYIQESNDMEFAKKCREAIFEQLGEVIVFPDIPLKEE